MAQILLIVGHHADEGNIDAQEHGIVGYRDGGAAVLSLPRREGGKRKGGNRV